MTGLFEQKNLSPEAFLYFCANDNYIGVWTLPIGIWGWRALKRCASSLWLHRAVFEWDDAISATFACTALFKRTIRMTVRVTIWTMVTDTGMVTFTRLVHGWNLWLAPILPPPKVGLWTWNHVGLCWIEDIKQHHHEGVTVNVLHLSTRKHTIRHQLD